MGDLIQTFPAITDAVNAIPGTTFDWVVEAPFSDVPTLHPAVHRVIPTHLRAWKKNIIKSIFSKAPYLVMKTVRQGDYDLVIDAQGLIKSAIVTRFARKNRHGFDKYSCREKLASLLYNKKHHCEPKQHAIQRIRQLFSQALNYPLPTSQPNFNITLPPTTSTLALKKPHVICLHSTTWSSKHWPEEQWITLIQKLTAKGLSVYLPWNTEVEHARAQRLNINTDTHILPKSNIVTIAHLLKDATAVVSVDTGLGHIASALNTTTITIYGATNPQEIGSAGEHCIHLRAHRDCSPCKLKVCKYNKDTPPCYKTVNAEKVFQTLMQNL